MSKTRMTEEQYAQKVKKFYEEHGAKLEHYKEEIMNLMPQLESLSEGDAEQAKILKKLDFLQTKFAMLQSLAPKPVEINEGGTLSQEVVDMFKRASKDHTLKTSLQRLGLANEPDIKKAMSKVPAEAQATSSTAASNSGYVAKIQAEKSKKRELSR